MLAKRGRSENPASGDAWTFVCLASQKNYMSVYLGCDYGDETWFRDAWAKTGKKLDMGKSCVRFKKLDDLALDVIGEALRRMPARAFLEYYESVIKTSRKKTTTQTPAKPAKKQAGKPTSSAKAKSTSAKPPAT